MSILKILQYPDSRLHRVGDVVSDPNDEVIQKLIDDIFESIAHYGSCAGLAATQLELDIFPRLFVMNRPKEEGGSLVFINPEIISSEGTDTAPEACMSVYPEAISIPLARAKKVTAKALDRFGKPFTIELEDFWARCMQHELDHLNGVLFIDRLSSLKRLRAEKKIKKILAERHLSNKNLD